MAFMQSEILKRDELILQFEQQEDDEFLNEMTGQLKEEIDKRVFVELELGKQTHKVRELREYLKTLKKLVKDDEGSFEITINTEEGSESERTEYEDQQDEEEFFEEILQGVSQLK